MTDNDFNEYHARRVLSEEMQSQREFAITELEKIKAEIEEKEFKLNCTTMSDVALKTAYMEVTKLLDKHIAELKGENNGLQ